MPAPLMMTVGLAILLSRLANARCDAACEVNLGQTAGAASLSYGTDLPALQREEHGDDPDEGMWTGWIIAWIIAPRLSGSIISNQRISGCRNFRRNCPSKCVPTAAFPPDMDRLILTVVAGRSCGVVAGSAQQGDTHACVSIASPQSLPTGSDRR